MNTIALMQVTDLMVSENCLPSDQVRRSIKRKLSEHYKQDPSMILCQHWYYVRIPQPWAHKGHPVMATVRCWGSHGCIIKMLEYLLSDRLLTFTATDEMLQSSKRLVADDKTHLILLSCTNTNNQTSSL